MLRRSNHRAADTKRGQAEFGRAAANRPLKRNHRQHRHPLDVGEVVRGSRGLRLNKRQPSVRCHRIASPIQARLTSVGCRPRGWLARFVRGHAGRLAGSVVEPWSRTGSRELAEARQASRRSIPWNDLGNRSCSVLIGRQPVGRGSAPIRRNPCARTKAQLVNE